MDRLIKLELGKLNAHLPERRMSLEEALSIPQARLPTKDGGICIFKREELELLNKILLEGDSDKLLLPIFVWMVSKLGRGVARISGEVEVRVANHVLGKERKGDELIIYRPEVAVLRSRLPTTTQYLFSW